MTFARGARGSMLVWGAALGLGCNLVFGIRDGSPASSTTSAGGATSSTGASTSASSGNAGAGGQAPALAVTPMSATLLARTTLTFTANVAGPVTWSVVEQGGGSVTPNGGAYTAPASGGTYHVEATIAATHEHADATVTVVPTVTPVSIVATGELETATGHGSQTHLVYAEGAGEWWLFRDPAGTGSLATSHSKTFATWAEGEAVALPMGHSGNGRDLSVSYRSLGGHDVVHVTQGYYAGSILGRYHVRAALSDGHATFDTPESINSIDVGPDPWTDGASTLIMPSGVVIDTSGVVPTPSLSPPGSLTPCGGGDVDVWTSDVADDGAAAFASAQFGAQVLWCVPSTVDARQLLAVGDVAVLLYVDGGNTPPGNVLMDYSQSLGMWTPSEPRSGDDTLPPRVFATDAAFDLDDWTAAVRGGAVHAVRRVGDAFEHRVMSTLGTWTDGGAIPSQSTLPASGLFLAPYGDGLVLVALSDNGGSQVLYTAFDGAAWTTWAVLSVAPGTRSYLAGFAPEGGKPAIVWTETEGASFGIVGALLP